MSHLKNHPYFSEYKDPETGAVSYILTERVAEIQQHFYFSEQSMTDDGKYMWFRCINAPGQYMHLAVVSMDPENPSIKSFPGAGWHLDGCPNIIPGTHDAVFPTTKGVMRITPDGVMTELLLLPEEFLDNRTPAMISTHLSVSADGRYISLDLEVADKWYIAIGDIKTGEVKFLNNCGRRYDHMQFSPTDPELFLIDQDWWRDWHTGEYIGIDNRIWLMNTKGTRFEPLIPNAWYGHNGTEICHDFWSPDGHLCWIDYKLGAFECDVKTREITHVWKRPTCHAQTNYERNLWVADQTPYAWNERPCETLFYDRETNKEIRFLYNPKPCVKREGVYHLDPHPSFTRNGEYIISTTTVYDGRVDVAITPVKPLLDLCREKGKEVK